MCADYQPEHYDMYEKRQQYMKEDNKMGTDTIIKRELLRELPNCEAFYRETWASGKVDEPVLLSWFFDGSPQGPEMDKTSELER